MFIATLFFEFSDLALLSMRRRSSKCWIVDLLNTERELALDRRGTGELGSFQWKPFFNI